MLVVLIFVATLARAATNDLSGLLQKGLFEEEANRNLDAATADYQTLVLQFDKDRQIGATAIFRLGEVYRKQGKTNEAAAQYERIVRDFAEQTTLVTLSRQNLTGLRSPENRSAWTPPQTSLYQVRDEIGRYRQLITNYQALPETNRLDSLCALFANDDVIGADCHEAALVRSRLKRLLRDDYTTNHPNVVKLQVELQPLEIKIEAYGREKIGKLVPLVESLEKELQRREVLEGLSPETTASGNRDSDLAQLKKLSHAELLQVLPTLVPDQLLTKLLEQLQTTQTKQAELRHDFGADHPNVQRLVAVEKTLHEQIDQRVTGILKALELRSPVSGPSKQNATVTTVADEEEAEIRRIQAMIRNSPDLINAPSGEGGLTPLHTAARQGQLTVARFLLDNGANANSKNSSAQTPLTLAVSAGHKAMTELLLSEGADVNARAQGGSTSLHIAAKQGYGGVAEVLLAHKANLSATDTSARTPLHLAASSGHSALMELLLRNGADPNAVGGGQTPLMNASQSGHAMAVKVLLSAKADVNAQTILGSTALSHAAGNGHGDVVKALLAAKADPNAGKLYTPLAVAVHASRLEVAETLLQAGADPSLPSKLSTELTAPGGSGLSSGRSGPFGPYPPLQIAIVRGGVEMVKLLLKHKADANSKEQAWYSPAQPLVVYTLNNTEILKAFLEGGADPDSNDRGGVPLIALAAKSHPAAIEPLILYKANVNVGDENGSTPLFWAVSRGDEESVQLLLKAGADVNAASQARWTPLHSAVVGGHAKIVKLLLANNADVNVRNSDGQTPLDLAKGFSTQRSPSLPAMLPSPGGSRTIPSRTLRQPMNAGTPAKEEPGDLSDVLRQHGALDELPDFTTIRITRQGLAQPIIVFRAHTNGWNQFTLLETVMRLYKFSQVWNAGTSYQPAALISFPDFGRLIIRRPSFKPGEKEKEIKVSLLNDSNAVDCTKDVPVEFGDMIEIPERVHALNETMPDPMQSMEAELSLAQRGQLPPLRPSRFPAAPLSSEQFGTEVKATLQRWACLQKPVQLKIAGESTPMMVDAWREGFLNQALGKTEARAALRSSSDLSRIKVTRKDAKSGKPVVLTVDATDANRDQLWLRDGDVIEVPDKP